MAVGAEMELKECFASRQVKPMQQDAAGIWQSPSGARIAWLKDPDGNLLSLTETRAR